MTTSETSLLDTNVLVYAADETSPFHVTRLYTYNKDDFIKFKEIEVLSP